MKGRDLVQLGQQHPDANVVVFHGNQMHLVGAGTEIDPSMGLQQSVLVLVVEESDPNQQLYPHYFSTYCIDNDHGHCRLTCKNCEKPCQCICHQIVAVK